MGCRGWAGVLPNSRVRKMAPREVEVCSKRKRLLLGACLKAPIGDIDAQAPYNLIESDLALQAASAGSEGETHSTLKMHQRMRPICDCRSGS